MKNALQIVNWFRARNYVEMQNDANAEELTQMKVMKLLYYVQGVCLAVYNKRAFPEDVLAWKYGPAVKNVHDTYSNKRGIVKRINNQESSDYKSVQDDPKLSIIVNSVYNAYGDMSAIELMKQTHNETPWKNTKQSCPMNDDVIKKYFQEEIVAK